MRMRRVEQRERKNIKINGNAFEGNFRFIRLVRIVEEVTIYFPKTGKKVLNFYRRNCVNHSMAIGIAIWVAMASCIRFINLIKKKKGIHVPAMHAPPCISK